ncbi:hypothetical protein FOL47_001254 [Perkinsus chesapeaki]|uniref:Uncharacterized protein n=1 Tax=Perkinsus chesapeaki TaxID=330153 RepID=A0A7J6MJY5_PERCH|nr:hypothetical protein FOL47_001254 [Perkinsus chesapeaki]
MNGGGGGAGGIGGGGGRRPFTSTFVRSIDSRDVASMERGSQTSASAAAARPSRWSTGGLGLGRRGADSPVWIERCYDTSTGLVTYNVVDLTHNSSSISSQGRASGASMAPQHRDSESRGLMRCQKGNANIVQALAVFLWSLKKASPEHFSSLPTAFKNATESFPPPNPPSYATTTSSTYPSLLRPQTPAAPPRKEQTQTKPRLSPEARAGGATYDGDLGAVGTPVVSTRASAITPGSPSPGAHSGLDGIDRLAMVLKDSIMAGMESRFAKIEEDIQSQMSNMMAHVQMVDHRVEITRIEQKQLAEEIQCKLQGLKDSLALHSGQFLNAVSAVEESVASVVASELSRERGSISVMGASSSMTPSNCLTPTAQEFTPHRMPINNLSVASPTPSRLAKSAPHVAVRMAPTTPESSAAEAAPTTPVEGNDSAESSPPFSDSTPKSSPPPTETDQAIDLSTKLASSLSESGFHVHREEYNYMISWNTESLHLRRGYLMWAFKAAGFHKDAIRPYPSGPGLLDAMILMKAGIKEYHISAIDIAESAQSALVRSPRKEPDEASASRMFRQMVSQYPGMVTLREELGHWVDNEGLDPALLLMPHATINPGL